MVDERFEEEGLEEELEQAPLVLPPETPGGPPVVLPVEVVRVPVPPAPVLLPRGVVTAPVSPAPVLRKEVNGEDLSDLFNVSKEDVLGDTEEGMDDLVNVSEEDVMGPGGADMSDLTSVSYKEVTGYDYIPPKRKRVAPRPPVVTRRPTPQGIIIRGVRE